MTFSTGSAVKLLQPAIYSENFRSKIMEDQQGVVDEVNFLKFFEVKLTEFSDHRSLIKLKVLTDKIINTFHNKISKYT